MSWKARFLGTAIICTACIHVQAQEPATDEAQDVSNAAAPTAPQEIQPEQSVSPERSELTSGESENAKVRECMIVVVGASGTPEYGELFTQWCEQWQEVAESSNVDFTLVGKGESEVLDRDRLKERISKIPTTGASPVWLVMIGHGTYARNVAKFNLRGRDVSATELSDWLQPLQRPLVVINCASSSGPFVNRLSGKGRVVVTATKSGLEQNFARFGKYLVQAMASADSDLDHDDEVSVQEAFVRASAEVERFYDSEERLATEHALIDDNGDGKGTPARMYRGTRPIAKAKDGSQLDGKIASRLTLAPTGNRIPLTESELKKRTEWEADLEALRNRKSQLSESEYDQELESILVKLAKLYRAAEKRP
ncbi:MAG: hypothetical protein AAGI63_17390 [Planctomycetota bacterium]